MVIHLAVCHRSLVIVALVRENQVISTGRVSFRYNKLSNSLLSVWDMKKQTLHSNGSPFIVGQTTPNSECDVSGAECCGSGI